MKEFFKEHALEIVSIILVIIFTIVIITIVSQLNGNVDVTNFSNPANPIHQSLTIQQIILH